MAAGSDNDLDIELLALRMVRDEHQKLRSPGVTAWVALFVDHLELTDDELNLLHDRILYEHKKIVQAYDTAIMRRMSGIE